MNVFFFFFILFSHSLPSNPALELEEETSWKVSTSSQSTSNIEVKVSFSDNAHTPMVFCLEHDLHLFMRWLRLPNQVDPSIANLQTGVQENVGTPSFSKGVLDEEWYTPETSLMELSYSLPYGISDTRTGFGMLESSLNFDSSSNLMSSFRPAPSALSMGLESNRSLEDLVCTGQGSSNVGLLSSLSPGLVVLSHFSAIVHL